jgi:hypothetical protein
MDTNILSNALAGISKRGVCCVLPYCLDFHFRCYSVYFTYVLSIYNVNVFGESSDDNINS